MFKKISWLAVTGLVALSLVLASCNGGTTEPTEPTKPTEPAAPTLLRIALNDFGTEQFDPNVTGGIWGFALFDNFLNWDSTGTPIGSAAESWSMSEDGRTWTFNVRKNVKFHNGDPMTSADFAFSAERFMSANSTNPWAPRLRTNFESMSTPDEFTYVHVTKKSELTLVASFAALTVLPSKFLKENSFATFAENPIGTGPWKYVKYTPNTTIEFAANENYWGGKPAFEKAIQLEAPEESTRIGMLKRDEVDLIFVTSDRTVELKNEGYRLQEIGLPTLANISFSGTWLTKGPTSDINVRKAMSYAIDRQELSDTFYKGLAKPGSRWFMSDVTWGWDPSWKADPFDPDMAKKLLTEAGYPGSFSTPTVKVFTRAQDADLMQILQGYWKNVGIDVAIEIVESAKFFDLMMVRAKDETYPVVGAIWPWVAPSTFQNVYHSSNMFTSVGVHSTSNDPEMDKLYADILAETDQNKQKQMWTEFTAKAASTYVNVGLIQMPTYWVVSKNLGEFTGYPHISVHAAMAGIKKPAK